MRGAVFLAALVLVIAGCAGVNGPSATGTTETPDDGPVSPTAPGPSATEPQRTSPSPTSRTPTPEPIPNPWQHEPVVIGINHSIDPGRNYTASVIRALEYWDAYANRTDWEPTFVVDPDDPSPDLEIRFVNRIDRCGQEGDGITIGCAPVLTAETAVTGTQLVRVNVGLTNESTYRVVRHELGHVLGLEHDEGPDDVMAPYDRVYDEVVRVHFAFETQATHEHRDTRRQVGYAFEYYADGADGFVEEELEFAVVEDPSAADVVVEINRRGEESRLNVTADGQTVIEMNGISVDRRGWHAGYWFGFYFGASDVAELPPPFDEPESDPRENWWH